MPIYEYRCAGCKRSFEMLVRSGDNDLRCPHCNSRKLSREMSTFAARTENGAAQSAISEACDFTPTPGGGGCCGGACGCR